MDRANSGYLCYGNYYTCKPTVDAGVPLIGIVSSQSICRSFTIVPVNQRFYAAAAINGPRAVRVRALTRTGRRKLARTHINRRVTRDESTESVPCSYMLSETRTNAGSRNQPDVFTLVISRLSFTSFAAKLLTPAIFFSLFLFIYFLSLSLSLRIVTFEIPRSFAATIPKPAATNRK